MSAKTFKSAKGMTLDTIRKELKRIAMGDLVELYNNYSGQKPIKKFRDRATAEAKVDALLAGMITKKQEGEAKAEAAKKKDQERAAKSDQPKLSKSAAGLLGVMQAMVQDAKTNLLTLDEIVKRVDSTDSSMTPLLQRLEKAGMVEYDSDDEIKLTELGESVDIRPDGKVPGRPGPRSKFSGKFIRKLVTENPRREGTWGHKSFSLIPDEGISYEDYREAGGRNNDLQWDIDHKYVEVLTPKK